MAGLDRVRQQDEKLGRRSISQKVEEAVPQQRGASHGLLKVMKLVGVGSETVQGVQQAIRATFENGVSVPDWAGSQYLLLMRGGQ
jgi:hypothetical protein